MKLPVEFKPCENCPNFQALLWGQEIICASMGHIIGGVVYCKFNEGGKDVGRDISKSSADSSSGCSDPDMVGG